MIVYSKIKKDFLEDYDNQILDEIVDRNVFEKLGKHTGESEKRAWRISLDNMGAVLLNSEVPDTAGIAIEYNIPNTSKRVDFIVSGKDSDNRNSAVIIELKQWGSVEPVPDMDGIVRTNLGSGMHETAHPSYQAWSYASAIANFNADVQDNNVILKPCAYLHNYLVDGYDPLTDDIYSEYLDAAPVFEKHDKRKLRGFIEDTIRKGDNLETIYMIDSGNLRPSKSLQDSLASMLEGNDEFVLLDTQKVVYEKILDAARKVGAGGEKRVIIVKGGPGTGKSVIAINLLCSIINMGMSSVYVTKNSAPRHVYKKKLKGKRKAVEIDQLFRGPDGFCDPATRIEQQVILVDEAHRLREKSGAYSNLGENQIREIMESSRLSVFFVDDDQKVTLKDIGSVDEVRKQAKNLGIPAMTLKLDSQFRCSGSDGYLAWLDNVLEIRDTANFDIGFDYDFRVFDDPNELRAAIEDRNRINNKSRIVAGYCWNWITEGKNDPSVHDIVIPKCNFEMSWNLGSTATWAIDPDSVKEAGCIHTCQGLEFDYVGVIIGDDLRFDGEHIVTDASKRAKTDQSLKGLKSNYSKEEAAKIADRIIKNTYKVLMSRGLKGCYVYCTSKQLGARFKSLTEYNNTMPINE